HSTRGAAERFSARGRGAILRGSEWTDSFSREFAMARMTMTEKILAKHAQRAAVSPGENIWVDVDVLMTHDVCGPGTIGVFYEHFGQNARVWDPDRVVVIPDHYIFTKEQICHRNVQILRD